MKRKNYPDSYILENMGIINKIAWSFHYTTGIDFEELQSEATLAYLEALRLYDSEYKVKLTTYAYKVINSRLITFCKDEIKNKALSLDGLANAFSNIVSIESEFMLNFTGKVKDLVDYVMEHSDSFVFTDSPKSIRGMIAQDLREVGWSWEKIYSSIRELKEVVRNN